MSKMPMWIKVMIGFLVFLIFIAVIVSSSKRQNSLDRHSTSVQPTVTPSKTPTSELSNAEKLAKAKGLVHERAVYVDLENAKSYLDQIPPTAPEYKDAKHQLEELAALMKRKDIEIAQGLRESLKERYRTIIVNANSHYNFIKAKITKVKGGYALWANHEFFNQYSFSAGEDARIVAEWITANKPDLEKAQIVQVGSMGEGPYSSSCWLSVK